MLQMLFLFCAGLGIVILVIQFGLALLGLGDDFDADAEGGFDGAVDADGEVDHHSSLSEAADADFDHPDSSWFFQVVSLKGMIAAMAFFGLGGLWGQATGMSPGAAIALGCILGVMAMYGVYWTMQQLYKLRSSGTVNIRNATGKEATIYIPVPANRVGKGKVQMQLQGRTYEFEAVTDENNKLPTGQSVVVSEVLGSDLVRVSCIHAEATTTV